MSEEIKNEIDRFRQEVIAKQELIRRLTNGTKATREHLTG